MKQALTIEFIARQIPFAHQALLSVSYQGQRHAKTYVADFVCCDQIIVEIKALAHQSGTEEAQLLNYMRAMHTKVGLLINFGSAGKL